MSDDVRDLCLVIAARTVVSPTGAEERQVLLGTKRRGFGQGRVVAPGGKVDAGESPRQAAARELGEETGLVAAADALTPRGVVTFVFPHAATPDLRAHLFVLDLGGAKEGAAAVGGHLTASDELDARWVPIDAIPWERMWADARHWLPIALERHVGEPWFWYAADGVSLAAMHL